MAILSLVKHLNSYCLLINSCSLLQMHFWYNQGHQTGCFHASCKGSSCVLGAKSTRIQYLCTSHSPLKSVVCWAPWYLEPKFF